jgi:hypothetical protein
VIIFRDDPFGNDDIVIAADQMPLGKKHNISPDAASKSLASPAASGMRVAMRFAARLAALTAIALLGYPAFANWLNGLLLLSAAFCVCIAELRREPLFADEFTHWDEAAAYGVVIGLVSLMS